MEIGAYQSGKIPLVFCWYVSSATRGFDVAKLVIEAVFVEIYAPSLRYWVLVARIYGGLLNRLSVAAGHVHYIHPTCIQYDVTMTMPYRVLE